MRALLTNLDGEFLDVACAVLLAGSNENGVVLPCQD